jgi:hypothetical protein
MRIFCTVKRKGIKEMKDEKATGNDVIPGDILRLLGKDGRRITTQVIKTIYENVEWPKDLFKFKIIALKENPKATKCSDRRTINLIAYTRNRQAKTLRGRNERKIEDVFGEDQYGFRGEKETKYAVQSLRIILIETLEID